MQLVYQGLWWELAGGEKLKNSHSCIVIPFHSLVRKGVCMCVFGGGDNLVGLAGDGG